MKLEQLGLKTKPATKYFDHGYIKFNTIDKELFYKIIIFTDQKDQISFESGTIKDQAHLARLLAVKTRKEIVEVQV